MFGQQKGLAKSELDDYESAMKHYQTLIIKDEIHYQEMVLLEVLVLLSEPF
ncbi:hypothetical protein [Candidatus Enterococcus ikei]|uniref:hypothetical protein n=1 Tax=Candidatus Enterococcus ikei TaxID=2815326 RepID=UPI001F5E3492|nr:hypothetical protein [Enterococcus sp. DIV0869a]